MEVAQATNSILNTPDQRYGMSAVALCADLNPDGYFVEKMVKAIIKFVDEPPSG